MKYSHWLNEIKLWLNGRKSENKEVRLKGLLFLIITLLTFIGMICGMFSITSVQFIFLLLAALFLYMSQVWPKWAKKNFYRKCIR